MTRPLTQGPPHKASHAKGPRMQKAAACPNMRRAARAGKGLSVAETIPEHMGHNIVTRQPMHGQFGI